MAEWEKVFSTLNQDAASQMEALRCRMLYALGGVGLVKILPYRGFGRPELLTLRGRVVEEMPVPETEKSGQLWDTLLDHYRRRQCRALPGARLAARFQGQEQQVVTDAAGWFELSLRPARPLACQRLWHAVELELLDPIPDAQRLYPVQALGQVMVPPAAAQFMVISDIDNALLHAGAAQLVKLARAVFLGHAHARLPFPGAAALHQALFSGMGGREPNPLFYLSAHPADLYDLLAQFFLLYHIPAGPLLFPPEALPGAHEPLPPDPAAGKVQAVRRLLAFYPETAFVLIGAADDLQAYAGLLREFPGRIKAAYFCTSGGEAAGGDEAAGGGEPALDQPACRELFLARDALACARHAAEHGLIPFESVPAVQAGKNKDEAPPDLLEKLLGKVKKGHAFGERPRAGRANKNRK